MANRNDDDITIKDLEPGHKDWVFCSKIAIQKCKTGRDSSGKAQWDYWCLGSKAVGGKHYSTKEAAQAARDEYARKTRTNSSEFVVLKVPA